jgi:hypothetical protein
VPAGVTCVNATQPPVRVVHGDSSSATVLSAPWTLTAPTLVLKGLLYNGVVETPTASGMQKALSFNVDEIDITSMVTYGNTPAGLMYGNGGVGQVVVVRNVNLLITEEKASNLCALSIICLGAVDYTPSNPPLIPPPGIRLPDWIPVTLSNVTVHQYMMTSDYLYVPGSSGFIGK